MSTNPAGLLLLDRIAKNDIPGLKALLLHDKHLVDIDWTNPMTGETALHAAVQFGNVETLHAVLSFKPTGINAKLLPLKGGHTSLHLAVLRNNPQLLEILLKNRADPHLNNSAGFSPLHIAVQLNLPNCLETLISRGAADAELRDSAGRTSAWWAQALHANASSQLLPQDIPINWDLEIMRGLMLAKEHKLEPTCTVASGKAKKGKKKKKGGKKK